MTLTKLGPSFSEETKILGLLLEKRKKSRLDKKKKREEEEVQRGRNFLIEYAERIRGAPKGFVPRLVGKEKLKKWPIFTHLSKPRRPHRGC